MNANELGGFESGASLRMLRFPEVVQRVGLCRSEITARVRRGEFPRPVPLGKRVVGFVAHEVDEYLGQVVRRAREHAAARGEAS